eukprot:TRINITY_DN8613_c0_g1_i3.p1 TRINITY_DN8613_c0_g1~~TRINITY_DN8613_c0_g1_i3.p1  ORF type:complete len:342 (-),score=92.84 TRINITY_DN8613_c0_g1_i3:399-1424(-)
MLYAATGIINYGGMFVKVSFKIVRWVVMGFVKYFPTLSGYTLVKRVARIVLKLLNQGAVSGEHLIERAWRTVEGGSSRFTNAAAVGGAGFLAKMLTVIRVSLLIGAGIVFFLKKRLEATTRQTTYSTVESIHTVDRSGLTPNPFGPLGKETPNDDMAVDISNSLNALEQTEGVSIVEEPIKQEETPGGAEETVAVVEETAKPRDENKTEEPIAKNEEKVVSELAAALIKLKEQKEDTPADEKEDIGLKRTSEDFWKSYSSMSQTPILTLESLKSESHISAASTTESNHIEEAVQTLTGGLFEEETPAQPSAERRESINKVKPWLARKKTITAQEETPIYKR